MSTHPDTVAMDRIHAILSGPNPWTSDEIEWVAEVVAGTGRRILGPEHYVECDGCGVTLEAVQPGQPRRCVDCEVPA